jgi:hypothetical protein
MFGGRLSKQFNETHKAALSGSLFNSYARYTVEGILFLRPDVAVAHIRQYPATNGQGSPAIYVMVKEQRTRQVAAGQNTLIQSSYC